MAQPLAADRARAGPGLAPLARLASAGQDHPQRDRVPDPHRPAAARIPPNPPRGPPAGAAKALKRKSEARNPKSKSPNNDQHVVVNPKNGKLYCRLREG